MSLETSGLVLTCEDGSALDHVDHHDQQHQDSTSTIADNQLKAWLLGRTDIAGPSHGNEDDSTVALRTTHVYMPCSLHGGRGSGGGGEATVLAEFHTRAEVGKCEEDGPDVDSDVGINTEEDATILKTLADDAPVTVSQQALHGQRGSDLKNHSRVRPSSLNVLEMSPPPRSSTESAKLERSWPGLNPPWTRQPPSYNDCMMWCDSCCQQSKETCRLHGPQTRIKDRIIPSRAKLTAPHYVSIKTLEYRAPADNVYAVYARKVIQKRTLFGPYEGCLTSDWKHDRDDRIKLKLFEQDGTWKHLDCTDQSACNWMMFVRPAANEEHQNMVAFQFKGAIYFSTIKAIPPNREMRIWYAAEYAMWMSEKLHTPFPPLFNGIANDSIDEAVHVPVEETETHTARKKRPQKLESPVRDEQGTQEVSAYANEEPTSDPGALCAGIAPMVTEAGDEEDDEEDVDDGVVVEHPEPMQKVQQQVPGAPFITEHIGEELLACAECGKSFISVDECQVHLCQVVVCIDRSNGSLAEVKSGVEGRHTRSKRKGRPVKIRPLPQEGDVKAVRRRGRPKGSKNKFKHTSVNRSLSAPVPVTKSTTVGKSTRSRLLRRVKKRTVLLPKAEDVPLAEEDAALHVFHNSPRLVLKKKKKKKVKRTLQLHHCEECDKAFTSETKLKVHRYIHTGERPFQCPVDKCAKAFTSKFKLMRHELIHSSNTLHFCAYCDKGFARKDHLKNHLKVHDPFKELLKCKECDKGYASSYAYRTHCAFHAADRGELVCGVCRDEFDTKEQLIHHLKVHAGARSVKDASDKKHTCPLCNKCFFTKKDVKRHLVVHTKDRDFMCHYCPQRFGRRDHLVRHLKKTHGSASGDELSDDDAAPPEKKHHGPRNSRRGKSRGEESEGNAAMVSELLQSVNKYMPSGEAVSFPGGDQSTVIQTQSAINYVVPCAIDVTGQIVQEGITMHTPHPPYMASGTSTPDHVHRPPTSDDVMSAGMSAPPPSTLSGHSLFTLVNAGNAGLGPQGAVAIPVSSTSSPVTSDRVTVHTQQMSTLNMPRATTAGMPSSVFGLHQIETGPHQGSQVLAEAFQGSIFPGPTHLQQPLHLQPQAQSHMEERLSSASCPRSSKMEDAHSLISMSSAGHLPFVPMGLTTKNHVPAILETLQQSTVEAGQSQNAAVIRTPHAVSSKPSISTVPGTQEHCVYLPPSQMLEQSGTPSGQAGQGTTAGATQGIFPGGALIMSYADAVKLLCQFPEEGQHQQCQSQHPQHAHQSHIHPHPLPHPQ